jgi:hypothetical protein
MVCLTRTAPIPSGCLVSPQALAAVIMFHRGNAMRQHQKGLEIRLKES